MLKFKVSDNYRFWLKLSLVFFFIQNITRIVLLTQKSTGLIDGLDVILDGFGWDLGTWVILSSPLMLASLFMPERWHKKLAQSKLNHVLIFCFAFFISVIGICEIIFWNEFKSRFNFIAVDYLIYTNEVLSNLKESYPLGRIIALTGLFSLMVTYATSKIRFAQYDIKRFLPKKAVFFIFSTILPLSFVLSIGPWLEAHDENFREDQLSRNGIYEFVRAFRSNKIDYKAFYPTLKDHEVENILSSKKTELSPSPFNFASKPNIVMIVVESLGAKFIGPLSNDQTTTPFLNKLSEESIFFKNFYATGTRTVRGLEALNLSVPPTPGYAVVKRPEHKGLYSLGNTFSQNGYSPFFLYGGRGFFDNMNSFFSGNQFKVIDQGDFNKNEVTFSNAWGVCDEDLFRKAEKEIASYKEKKPFFMFLLTTSNHRPFTYPDGKIDIPSGDGRLGAVKYTDYAIGNFLKESVTKPWAKNTIFIVVADHSTEGRGQFDLEMRDFHIPLWIYSPSLIKPQVVTKLGSQIDLLPTLIHMLGLKDESPFYGQSFFNTNWKEERAFIGNYQFVGYYKNKVLTTLGPNQTIRNYSYDPETRNQLDLDESPYLNEAITYYQSSSHKLDRGLYKVPIKAPK